MVEKVEKIGGREVNSYKGKNRNKCKFEFFWNLQIYDFSIHPKKYRRCDCNFILAIIEREWENVRERVEEILSLFILNHSISYDNIHLDDLWEREGNSK